MRAITAAYLFSNTLVVLEITEEILRALLERCASYFTLENGTPRVSDAFLAPKVEHYNYDFFSGIDYVIDVSRPVGSRVTSVKLNGKELGMDELVTVCINSYRFCGTGGYDMLPKQKVVREVLTDVADAMIEYITTHPNIHIDTHRYCTVVG